jgi:hypothetical protein
MFCDELRLPAANGGWWACCNIREYDHMTKYLYSFFGGSEECILTWLLDKCKEEGCMNIREYHNSKEKYFKYCLKRMLFP